MNQQTATYTITCVLEPSVERVVLAVRAGHQGCARVVDGDHDEALRQAVAMLARQEAASLAGF
jgi:hypothetical protein